MRRRCDFLLTSGQAAEAPSEEASAQILSSHPRYHGKVRLQRRIRLHPSLSQQRLLLCAGFRCEPLVQGSRLIVLRFLPPHGDHHPDAPPVLPPRVVLDGEMTTLDAATLGVQAHIAVLLKFLLLHDNFDIASL